MRSTRASGRMADGSRLTPALLSLQGPRPAVAGPARLVRRQETPQDSSPELERVGRDTLVDSVEHPREVELGGKAQRREPVPGDAEAAEGLVVGPARERIREHVGARI